jgi:hypothetical protein
MRWYINDDSLQGQFGDAGAFELVMRPLVAARLNNQALGEALRTTRTLTSRPVTATQPLRLVIQQWRDEMLRRLVLVWLDRSGPFLEDDRHAEADDFFEYLGKDVTDCGLGEAARRVKGGEAAVTFSFEGGTIDFALSPLRVDHGLAEERLGHYEIRNVWTVQDLISSSTPVLPAPTTWGELMSQARGLFPLLLLPETIEDNRMLSREPFSAAIASRALVLLSHLNTYMEGRRENGSEGPVAREVVDNFFTGERALFTGESVSNLRDFAAELTFPDPSGGGCPIVAEWHGKISHRYFRLHFQWPVPAGQRQLKVLYLGPKITRD